MGTEEFDDLKSALKLFDCFAPIIRFSFILLDLGCI